MIIEIQSIDFTSKQELKNFVYEKVNTLVRFYKQVIGKCKTTLPRINGTFRK